MKKASFGPVVFMQGSRARIMNIISIVGGSAALVSAFFGREVTAFAVSHIVLAAVFITALVINSTGRIAVAEHFVTIATTIWIAYISIAFGSGLGVQNYLIIALVAWSIFSSKDIITLSLIIVIVIINLYQQYYQPLFPLPASASFFYFLNVLIPLLMIAMMCRNFVKDTVKAQQTIERQKEELAESNIFKDRVFSIIGHDMRSPFNSAKGLVELLDSDLLTEEERKNVLQELRMSIDVSLQTLDNILGWASQSYYGAIMHSKTKTEALNIYEIVERNILLYNQPAIRKNINFVNNVIPGTPASGDVEQIAFVLRNLTSNALKFSHSGQAVTFDASVTEKEVIISVKDEGVGMNSEALDSLFRISTRFSKEGTIKEKGSGLGLIFCKEFIENNKGKLWIESESGKGTTVYFSLPKKMVAAMA